MKPPTHDWEGRWKESRIYEHICGLAAVAKTFEWKSAQSVELTLKQVTDFLRTEIEATEKRREASQKELLESLVLMYEQYCQDGHAFMTAGETASSTLENHGYRFDEVGRIIASPTKDKGEDVTSKKPE